MEDAFLCLITRCKDEYFIAEFCAYYLNEGVDVIYVIDDDSADKSIYTPLVKHGSQVEVIYDSNILTKNSAQRLYEQVRGQFEWIIYVDVDEFITTRKDNGKTIRDMLETTFKDADCVKIPWVMMACDSLKEPPASILMTNVYRWDHDKTHPNSIHKFRCRHEEIEIKSVFRTSKFSGLRDHHPINPLGNPNIVESIKGTRSELDPFYKGLREVDIEMGHLLCYHYRIISIDNCQHKVTKNKFYMNAGFSVADLMSSDHPEIQDFTLKNKALSVSVHREYGVLS